jgi:hypothetical protein
MPMGTTPKVSFGKVRVFSGKIKSTTARIKRRIPPATLKSETKIPRKAKTDLPTTKNPMLTKKAVRIDCRTTFLRSGGAISPVRETKIGRIPRVSKATKNGIKGKKILREISGLKNEIQSIHLSSLPFSKDNPFFLFVNPINAKEFAPLEAEPFGITRVSVLSDTEGKPQHLG